MNYKNVSTIARYVLGGIVTAGFFVLLYILIFVPIKVENQDILNITVGALIGSFSTVVGYFFGSSAGSAQKTELMANKMGDDK